MADNTTKNLTFTMPAGDLTLTAVASKVPLDTSYSVAYYYQKNGEYPKQENPDDILPRTGKTGQYAEITPADKVPIKEGYAYDDEAEGKVENTGESGVAADGSTTLRVYFKEQFTVTYKPGEHGSFEAEVIRNLNYGANVPVHTVNLDGNNGYVFDTWKLTKIGDTEVTEETELPSAVTANLEYTAMWKAMPIPTITHRPTEWTNQNVIVTITAPEPGYGIEYRIDENTNWIEYTEEFEVEQNCIISARLAKETNKGEEVGHEISNIDKIRPQFGEKTINEEKSDEAIIIVKATDNLSGIVEYGITKEGYAQPRTYKCENITDTKLTFNEIYENGIYKIYLKDKAGNIGEDTVQITNITGFNVARIVEAPEGHEDLIGTEYETLSLALQTSDEAAQVGNVKIEIIHNIYNEINTVQNGRDYTINLNNYYIKNQEAKPTLTINGRLQIVDEGKSVQGTVSSPFGLGIYISKVGELTLGQDDTSVPSIMSPIVEGKTYGIQKEIDSEAEKVYDENSEEYYYPEGVCNFYDGKVIGGTSAFLMQRINDTPALYDPTVITNSETKNQESILAKVSGIEAVIGKKRYMQLEDAIDDANNVIGDSNTQVEIKIVRDIAKDAEHKAVVDSTKNIKLDLNGHVFTTTADDYVLENYGELEIYDSSETINEETGEIIPGTGIITSSTESTILNGIQKDSAEEMAYEDIDLSQAVAKGEYYFETRAEGGLISNNTNIHNSTAHSLLELDLTGKEGVYEIVTNITISSENTDYGYITIRNDDKIVNKSEEHGRKVYVSGSEEKEYKVYLCGGEKYYIQFGYEKDGSYSKGNDCFIIKSMKYGKKEAVGNLTITSGTYECTKQGNGSSDNQYCGVIQNESKLYINGGELKSSKKYTAGVYNGKSETSAYAEINGGKINTYDNSIFNRGIANINGGSLISSSNNEGRCSVCVRNKGNLEIIGENTEISGYNAVYTETTSIINAGNFHFGYRGIDNFNTTIINGGQFINDRACSYNSKSAIYNSKGNIKINNAKVVSGDMGVNNYNGIIEIDNIDVTSVNSNGVPTVKYGLIHDKYSNESNRIVFNGGDIYTQYSAAANGNGNIEINGGTLRTYYSNDYNYNGYSTHVITNGYIDNYYTPSGKGTVKITGGTIIAPRGISNKGLGNIIVTGGMVEATENVGIENNASGIITIGSKDENVSKETPVIKSAVSNAIKNEFGTFNYYDGVLIGKENSVIGGFLNDMPEEKELDKEVKADGLQYVTIGMPTSYVAKIAETDNPDVSALDEIYYKLEDGYYHFTTLDSAIKACSKLNPSTIELIADSWVYRPITIDEAQDVTIKFKNKTIYLYAPLNFENNGKINFINENAENVSEEERVYGNIKASGGLLIKNNENAEMNLDNISIRYESSTQSSSDNVIKLLDNYGNLNINNSKYDGGSGTNTLYYVYGVYNEESGILNINNTTMSGLFDKSVINTANDKTDETGDTIYATTIRNSTITGNNLLNNGLGTVLIENSTISLTTYNNLSGNIIIRNSTGNRSVYNESTGYIEIDNSVITEGNTYNKSSGKLLIKGADSRLNGIENRNVDGIVEIQAGTISNNYGAIENCGILIISGGNVICGNSDYEGIENKAGAKATISGSNTTITGPYGIKNEGELIIKSGKITGTRYRGINNTNKLTLGDKDGNIEYSPVVNGKTDGIYNSGTFNFYDGIIEGNETSSIKGVIPSETEEDSLRVIHKGEYTFNDKTENGYSVASGREISVLEQINVAYVVSKDKNYTSLAKALADIESSDTIKIVHDVSINGVEESLVIPENKNITLDLNGFNVIVGNNNTIVNNGTLRVIDGTSHEDESGNIIEGKFVSGGNTILENNGTATIENGSYELTMGGSSSNYYNMFSNTGTLEINSKGTFKEQGTYSRLIYNTTGEVLIKNSILTATGSNTEAIYNGTGTINIEGKTINGQVNNKETGTINIKDGTINGVVNNYSEGAINVSGGTIQNGNSYSINNTSNGIINITGGTIRGVCNNSNGEINIRGGTIKGGYGISAVYNYSTGTINIDGTNLSEENAIQVVNDNSANTYSVQNSYNATGTINYSITCI
ncbi:MAG TPA: hypothetical protein DCZ30_08070, partial [Clostridiales bacterium]|nr:hypothetical protein [Clostridiales bacterium]